MIFFEKFTVYSSFKKRCPLAFVILRFSLCCLLAAYHILLWWLASKMNTKNPCLLLFLCNLISFIVDWIYCFILPSIGCQKYWYIFGTFTFFKGSYTFVIFLSEGVLWIWLSYRVGLIVCRTKENFCFGMLLLKQYS